MSVESAQGGIAAAAEPTMLDDGFSAEERAAFEGMMGGDTGAGDPPSIDNTPAEPPLVVQGDPGTEPPVANADTDDDDDDADPQAQAQPKPGEKPLPRRVNINKFLRMEERAKKAETEAQQIREMFTRTDERLKLLNDALTSGQQKKVEEQRDEDPEPDPEKDIFGWAKWAQRDRARMQQQLTKTTTHVQQKEQTEHNEQALATFYRDDARNFAEREAQFAPAYNFLFHSRAVELAAAWYGKDVAAGEQLTPPELARIRSTISAEEKSIVIDAAQNRQSPAARIFTLAKARGFRPQAAPAAQNGQPGQGQPAPRQNAPAASAAPSVADEIARIQRGTAHPSLSQGGGSPATPLTAEKLASMGDDEFGAYLERMTEAQQRQLFGA